MMVIFRVKQRTEQGTLCDWMFWQHRTACMSKKNKVVMVKIFKKRLQKYSQ